MNETNISRETIVGGRRLILAAIVTALMSMLMFWNGTDGSDLPDGISHEDFEDARSLLAKQQIAEPERVQVLSMLGELSVRDNDLQTAIKCFEAIPADHPKYGLSAKLQAGQILVRLNLANDAERNFRTFLSNVSGQLPGNEPPVTIARQWLSFLMAVQLRFAERQAILQEQEQSGMAAITDSTQLYFPSLLIWNSTTGRDRLREFLKVTPNDPHLNVARGRYLTGEGRLEEAESQLRTLWQTIDEPEIRRNCLAALLECYFEGNDWTAFQKAIQQAPPPSSDDPWLLTLMRGQFAIHRKNWDNAIEHFTNYLTSDPTSTTACMGLARAYREIDRKTDAKAIEDRMLILAEIRPKLTQVNEGDLEAIEELVDQCHELELESAADAFSAHARRIRKDVQK